MPELAACYFCGAALDAPTDEYRLGSDPDAPTVTLCEGCREKLDRVLDTLDGTGGAAHSTPGPDPTEASPGSETSPAAHQSDDAPAEDDATPGESEAGQATGKPSPSAGVAEETGSTAGGAAGVDEDSAEVGETEAPEPDAADADGDDTAGESRAVVEGDQEISALEYNKVMRLLQNREFPVDRDEIVTVTANAYQVSRATCERVIDAAIDRDLLDEREGQLYRAE